jgi:exonuclease VII large subunit
MNRVEAVAEAIQRATGNILVVVRGGGDPASFEVFDHKVVLRAWAAKSAYKALSLGHEGTGASLIEFVSDYVGSTPTAVGAFLEQKISAMDYEREQMLKLDQQRAASEERNRNLTAQLASSEEQRTLAVQQTLDIVKRTKERWIVVTAFLLGLVFELGTLVGYHIGR